MSAITTRRGPFSRVAVLITIGLLLAGLLPVVGARGQEPQEQHVFSHGELPPGWNQTDWGRFRETFDAFVKPIDHPFILYDAYIDVLFPGADYTMDECRSDISRPDESGSEPDYYNTLHLTPIGALEVWEQEFGGWPAIIAEGRAEMVVLHSPGPGSNEPVLESFGPIDGLQICVDTPNGVYAIIAAARPSARAETDDFLNTFQFGIGNRHLTVRAFDGTDNRRYPLMFAVLFEKDTGGKTPPREPLADERIFWKISNETSPCFKHHYDAWDPRTSRYVRHEHNMQFIGGDDLVLVTDAKGRAYLRLYFSFDGMKVGGIGSPCSLPIEIELTFSAPSRDVDPAIVDDKPPMIDRKGTLTLNHAAFITSVHADIPNRMTYITRPDSPAPLPPQGWFNIVDYGEEHHNRVYSRIFIDDQPFVPPVPGARRFVLPLPLGTTTRPGAVLTLDMSYRFRPVIGETREWSPDPGTAIGVEVMWIDGSRAMFIAKNRENIRSPEVHMVIAPVISDVRHQDPNYAFLYFLGSNGLEFVAQVVTTTAATAINPALGATVAGAWGIYEFYDTPRDLYEMGEILSRNGYMIIVQSEVALTLADDGTHTVYTFEGAPAVYQDGVLTQAFAGEAIDIAPDWTVGPAVQREPPESAQELRELLAAAGAPGEVDDPTIIEPGAIYDPEQDTTSRDPVATAVPGVSTATPTSGDGVGQLAFMLAVGAAVLGVFVLIAILRNRKPSPAPQPAGGPQIPGPIVQPPATHDRQRQPHPPARAAPAAHWPRHVYVTPVASDWSVAPEAPAVAATLRCTVCGASVLSDARFCSSCGSTIPEPVRTGHEAATSCARCGARVNPGARFCMTCGAPLAEGSG